MERWLDLYYQVRHAQEKADAVCGQPDDVMERWLDQYYQVRHAQENTVAAVRTVEKLKEAMERLKEAEPFLIPGTLEAVDTRAVARAAPTMKDEAAPEPPPEKKAEKAEPSQSAEERVAPSQALRASSPQGASQENSEDDEAKSLPKDAPSQAAAPEKPVKRPSQIGNTRVHDAAVFKRQVRDRLEAARKNGVSAPEIIKAAPGGEVTPDRIYSMLEGRVLKIEVYRALDKALRHFEN